MELYESRAKHLLEEQGLLVPTHAIANSANEVYRLAEQWDTSVVIKPQWRTQTATYPRGRVQIAQTANRAYQIAYNTEHLQREALLHFLIEQWQEVMVRLFVGFTIDYSTRQIRFIVASDEDVDAARMVQIDPATTVRQHLDPVRGLLDYQLVTVASGINIPYNLWGNFKTVIKQLYGFFVAYDVTTMEVNPLALTSNGVFSVLSTRILIDDKAMFRQRSRLESIEGDDLPTVDLSFERTVVATEPTEMRIGCIVNEATLGALVTDSFVIYSQNAGTSISVLLTIPEDAEERELTTALRQLNSEQGLDAFLLCFTCGTGLCDELMAALMAFNETDKPITIWTQGNPTPPENFPENIIWVSHLEKAIYHLTRQGQTLSDYPG